MTLDEVAQRVLVLEDFAKQLNSLKKKAASATKTDAKDKELKDKDFKDTKEKEKDSLKDGKDDKEKDLKDDSDNKAHQDKTKEKEKDDKDFKDNSDGKSESDNKSNKDNKDDKDSDKDLIDGGGEKSDEYQEQLRLQFATVYSLIWRLEHRNAVLQAAQLSHSFRHFIPPSQRPDISGSPLRKEPDLSPSDIERFLAEVRRLGEAVRSLQSPRSHEKDA